MWCDQRWQVAHHAGDHETHRASCSSTLRRTGDPHWMVYDAIVAADRGDVRAVHGGFVPEIAALGQRWPRWAARLWDAMQRAARHARADLLRIADLVARLEPDAGHWAVLGGGVLVHGPVSRLARPARSRTRRLGSERCRGSTQAEAAASALDAQLGCSKHGRIGSPSSTRCGTADGDEIVPTIAAAARARDCMPIVERLQGLSSAARASGTCSAATTTSGPSGSTASKPDARHQGATDLQTLLANPGVDIPATSLATGAFVSADRPPVLDARAKADYRRRLDELDRELDRAGIRGDAGAGREARAEERAALLDELRRAAGLGGRDRRRTMTVSGCARPSPPASATRCAGSTTAIPRSPRTFVVRARRIVVLLHAATPTRWDVGP